MRRLPTTAALFACATACTQVPSAARPPIAEGAGKPALGGSGASHYIPGEAITWDVRWLDVIMGGMSLAVGHPGEDDGKQVIIVRIEAHTAGVLAKLKKAYSELATMLDVETGVPLKVAGNIDDLFSGDVMDSSYEQKDINLDWRSWQGRTPSGAPVVEIVGFLGWLRGWRGEVGDEAHFFANMRGRIYRVDVVARRGETARQLGTSVRVVRVDGIMTHMTDDMEPDLSDTYPFIGWATDDERRVPVRIHVQNKWGGTVELEMTRYSGPKREPASVSSP